MQTIIRYRNYFILLCCLSFFMPTAFAATSKQKSIVPIQYWQTQNGAAVYFVREPSLPILDLVTVFDAGSSHDGKQYGLAALTNSLFFTATKHLNEDQIANDLESVGAKYNSSVSRDMASISLRTLVKPSALKSAIDIFAAAVNDIKFTKTAFIRIKKQQLRAIKAQYQSPASIANLVFYKLLYGNHPYGHAVIGNKETVSHLQLKYIRKFYHRYYVGKNAILVMVGDITAKQAHNIANKIVGQLPTGQHATKIAATKTPVHAKKQVIAYPSDQTAIRLGTIGISRSNPDYFPLAIGNYILGGGMNSRLFQQVREKRGLSYAVYSFFSPLLSQGPFTVMLQTKTTSVPEALKVSKTTLHQFIQQGPSKQELQAAKKYLIGSFPLGIANNAAILANVVNIAYYHLPRNYLDTYRAKVQAVTIQDIKQAFAKYLQNKPMVTVVVGKSMQHNKLTILPTQNNHNKTKRG